MRLGRAVKGRREIEVLDMETLLKYQGTSKETSKGQIRNVRDILDTKAARLGTMQVFLGGLQAWNVLFRTP